MKLVSAKCPNCGANIDVDQYSDSTKCEYCNSKIVVEEAIQKFKLEVSGKIEIDTASQLKNYLKLGETYWNSKEYEDSYKYYDMALELDANNWHVFFRKGLAKALNSEIIKTDMTMMFNTIKNTFNLMNKDDEDSINTIVSESLTNSLEIRKKLYNYEKNNNIVSSSFFKDSKLSEKEVEELLNKYKIILSILELLYNNVKSDSSQKEKIQFEILVTINLLLKERTCFRSNSAGILNNGANSPIKLNRELKKQLIEKKKEYSNGLSQDVLNKIEVESENYLTNESLIFIIVIGVVGIAIAIAALNI